MFRNASSYLTLSLLAAGMVMVTPDASQAQRRGGGGIGVSVGRGYGGGYGGYGGYGRGYGSGFSIGIGTGGYGGYGYGGYGGYRGGYYPGGYSGYSSGYYPGYAYSGYSPNYYSGGVWSSPTYYPSDSYTYAAPYVVSPSVNYQGVMPATAWQSTPGTVASTGAVTTQSFYPPSGAVAASATNQIALTVKAPANAEVWLNGSKMSGNGPTWEYKYPASGPLSFSLRCTWKEEGHDKTQTQTFTLEPGVTATMEFPVKVSG